MFKRTESICSCTSDCLVVNAINHLQCTVHLVANRRVFLKQDVHATQCKHKNVKIKWTSQILLSCKVKLTFVCDTIPRKL